jgi:hypothetical protein
MNKLAVAVVGLLLLACCRNASAQPSQCPACENFWPSFGNCAETVLKDPPDGRIAFTGTVIAAKVVPMCRKLIRVEVTRSSDPLLPKTIDIDHGSCIVGGDTVGAAITALVSAKPGRMGTYSARPDSECWKDGRPR